MSSTCFSDLDLSSGALDLESAGDLCSVGVFDLRSAVWESRCVGVFDLGSTYDLSVTLTSVGDDPYPPDN